VRSPNGSSGGVWEPLLSLGFLGVWRLGPRLGPGGVATELGLWRDVGRIEERGLDVVNWASWPAGPRKGKSQLGLAG
jgi:hypothetical protein